MEGKLKRSDWIDLGLKELTESGYGALNAQSLAKKMNVSRGSFYWHFKNIEDFRMDVINAWRRLATDNIISAINAAPSPRKRLESLIRETLRAPQMELSVRAWAKASNTVAKSTAEIDDQRYAFVQNLLRELGVDESDVKYRSLLLYWAAVGRTVVLSKNLHEFSEEDIKRLADLMIS